MFLRRTEAAGGGRRGDQGRFDAWESRRLVGLYDQAKPGRPPKCTPEQQDQIRQWAKAFPKNLNKIGALVAEHFDLRISKQTLKRLLKAMAFSWRRIRKGLKGEPDPEEYQQKKEALQDLQFATIHFFSAKW
jgi:transposase